MSGAPWLRSLSRAFKAHRLGRPGWFLEINRERLRVVSAELPPRPGEAGDGRQKRRAVTLKAPPGPSSSAAALVEACSIFDAVMAGTWSWPDPSATPKPEDAQHLSKAAIDRLSHQLEARLVGEQMTESTWKRTWSPYLTRLAATAEERDWDGDAAMLNAYLRLWQSGSRSRQMAYDRARRIWKEARWPWPDELASLRGNGKAAANPGGVRAFTDQEISTLREAIQNSRRLTESDLVAWDCLIVFGLRPAELQGLTINQGEEGIPIASVTRAKRSSKGSSGPRKVTAVPPAGWPPDCYDLLKRWQKHKLPKKVSEMRSPGERLSQQLRRLHFPSDLTAYGMRHAFALRLGVEIGLSVREAAEEMGHKPGVHINAYGTRLDKPKLQRKIAEQVITRAKQ